MPQPFLYNRWLSRFGYAAGISPDPAFKITVKTDNSGPTNDDQFLLPLFSGETYNAIIDWGDDTTTIQTDDVSPTHTYPAAGTYQISITGIFPRIYFNNGGDKDKLLSIDNWGSIIWSSMQAAFYNCGNMTATFTDDPILTNVTNMTNMFRSASLFNADLSGWDVSNVTDMNSIFRSASLFNGDLSSWDVSNVTNMPHMFRDAPLFNGDLSSWDVSNVTNMTSMFRDAPLFNADLSSWDVSNVTSMLSQFRDCLAFDQNIGNWDITSCTSMNNMLLGSTLSTINYDSLLVGWELQAVNNNISFHGGSSTYSAGAPATARAALIADHIWTIVDGGPA